MSSSPSDRYSGRLTRPTGPEGAHEADSRMGEAARRTKHWDDTYTRLGPEAVSWYQSDPRMSLELVERVGVPRDAAVIDVGGGSSLFVDRLLAKGFSDVTVLDVSAAGLDVARRRLEGNPAVTWEPGDVLSWRPARRYDLWHDRAVFHFLIAPTERQDYLRAVRKAVAPGGHLILATFAPDGPRRCSGLPVARYSPADLLAALGSGFAMKASVREEHTTPAGVLQPFTWLVARATF